MFSVTILYINNLYYRKSVVHVHKLSWQKVQMAGETRYNITNAPLMQYRTNQENQEQI